MASNPWGQASIPEGESQHFSQVSRNSALLLQCLLNPYWIVSYWIDQYQLSDGADDGLHLLLGLKQMPVENYPVNLVVQGGHVQDNTPLQLSITSCLHSLTEHDMSETKHTPCTTIGFIPCFDVCQMAN